MKNPHLPVLAAALGSILLATAPAIARDGALAVERWTYLRAYQDGDKTRHEFLKETFSLRTDGTASSTGDNGKWTYSVGGNEDDTLAIQRRQAVDGRYVMVEWEFDTDPDKARFTKAGPSSKLNSDADPVSWVPVAATADGASPRSIEDSWSALAAIVRGQAGNAPGLGAALVSWLLTDYAHLPYNDQVNFASRAGGSGLHNTDLRAVEATLRATGFPLDPSRLLPAGGVDIALSGLPSVNLHGNVVSIGGVNVRNNRLSSSGPLQVQVYALHQPYVGGEIPGDARLLASATISDPVGGGANAANLSWDTSALVNLPGGIWYFAVILSDGNQRLDHAALSDALTLGEFVGGGAGEQDKPTQLINLSTRLRVEAGDGAGIGGFVVSGTGSKRVLLRALGPSMASAVAGTINNLSVELRDSQGRLVAANAGWQSSPQRGEIEAAGLAPQDVRECALVASLSAGSYTLVVRGAAAGESGVALIEMYDLERVRSDLRPVNVSTRGVVRDGDNVMIGGFVIGGSRTKRVVVRALGPSLAAAGVPNPLANPSLAVFDSSGALLASNADWRSSATQDQIAATGRAPTNDREAAAVLTLRPGPYTVVVRGEGGSTGVALVEVYEVE